MRRIVFAVVGVLQLAAAGLLAVLAFQLPGRAEVDDSVGRVVKVSRDAGQQVGHLRAQVATVRARQPELLALSRRLEKQMRHVSATVQSKRFNGDGLESVGEALGHIASGMDNLTTTLDPKGVAQIGKGIGGTADYLENKVMPAAEKAATTLEKAGATLEVDGAKLKTMVKDTPLELKAARASLDSLAKFEEGLERLGRVAKLENLDAMRDGFKGMEESLGASADQIDKVAKITIPKVSGSGLNVKIEQQDFWPDGKTISQGMRKAAKGCQAAGKELDAVRKELPRLQESLEHSRKVVGTTRRALADALAQQEKLEPVLRRLPANLARMAEELPKATAELARVLRETARLKDVATALRQAERGIQTAQARWPQLHDNLANSAKLLRATQKQLESALSHRDDFETTVRHTVELTALFAESLPVMLDQMDVGLREQERSLGDLGDSIDQVTESLPAAGKSAARLLAITRWLLGLVALAVAIHGAYQLSSASASRT